MELSKSLRLGLKLLTLCDESTLRPRAQKRVVLVGGLLPLRSPRRSAGRRRCWRRLRRSGPSSGTAPDRWRCHASRCAPGPSDRRAAPARTTGGSRARSCRASPPAARRPGCGTPPPQIRTGCPSSAARQSTRRSAGDRTAADRRLRSAVTGAACSESSRKNSDPDPCSASPPDLVTTLMAEPADRPRSAAKRLVAIWNSCTPSWTMLSSGPPTTSSLLSMPSIVMLPPRPSCPADEMTTELVLVGSKFGAGALPGTSSASSMKLRPLSGSRSMEGAVMTASTTDRAVSTSPAPAASTTTSSRTPATVSVASRSSTCPTRSVTASKRCGAKPDAATGDDKAARRQVGQQVTARWRQWSPRATSRSPMPSPLHARQGRAWTAGRARDRARSLSPPTGRRPHGDRQHDHQRHNRPTHFPADDNIHRGLLAKRSRESARSRRRG